MASNLGAKTQMTIHASAIQLWDTLTTPDLIKKYTMRAGVKSDWMVASPLTCAGVYKDKPFLEKGVVCKLQRAKLLKTTHFSITCEKEDKPENDSIVTWELGEKDGRTVITVSQDGTRNEEGIEGNKANWDAVLKGLKQRAEGS